jgi:hypothetical protein
MGWGLSASAAVRRSKGQTSHATHRFLAFTAGEKLARCRLFAVFAHGVGGEQRALN